MGKRRREKKRRKKKAWSAVYARAASSSFSFATHLYIWFNNKVQILP
jgi:hypothetical protein